MRPVPQKKHVIAIAVFVALAAAAEVFAFFDDRLDDHQIYVATAALKRHDGRLYPHDPIFSDESLWRFHTPSLQGLFEMVLVPTNYKDPTLPFRLLVGPALLAFLGGMYALLYRQCRSWSVSAAVAVMSSVVITGPGGAQWGIGSLASLTAAGLCLSLAPLIVLTFLRYERRWQILLVFVAIGLLGNVHLLTAINLALVMLAAYLGRNRFAPRAWGVAAACGLVAAIMAAPYAVYYLGLRHWLGPEGTPVSYAVVHRALRDLDVLYPRLLTALLEWDLMIRLLVLAVAVAVSLWRVERFVIRDLTLWEWMIGSSIVIAFGLQGVSQLVGRLHDTPPPVIDFLRASGLVFLPLYVLFAQGLTNLFRLSGTHTAALRWTCVVFLAAWLAGSDNLRVPRHAMYDAYDAILAGLNPSQPPPERRHRLQAQAERELAAIADWVRRETPSDASVLADSTEFRMLSRRSIVACDSDVRYFYYMAPWRLEGWMELADRQKSLLHPPAGRAEAEAMTAFLQSLSQTPPWRGAPQWYILLHTGNEPAPSATLREIASPAWGRDYRLYQIQ